uniref:TAF6-like RNA polymerase II, p300/CBP-associated factor (PCAF)-associated factor n=1 Tax=Salmo trutta TaxID=8032 RepID=A0A673X8A4_SALTR
ILPSFTLSGAVQTLSEHLLKYNQQITWVILGEDPPLMKVALLGLQSNCKIAALLQYFVHVISGVKSMSHELKQLNCLLHMVKSLVQNLYLYLGSYVRILEPLAASNSLNDHRTLREYAALTHGNLVSGLYHQILLVLQKVLSDPVRPLCSHYGAAVERAIYPYLQAVPDDYSVSNAQVKAGGHKVYGAILGAVEHLLKIRALSLSLPAGGGSTQPHFGSATLGIASHLQGPGGAGTPWNDWTPSPCPPCTVSSSPLENNLAVCFSTDPDLGGCLPLNTTYKMPQLTANLKINSRQDGSPRTKPSPPIFAATPMGYLVWSQSHYP